MRRNMSSRRSEVLVTKFLRDELAVDALGVPDNRVRGRRHRGFKRIRYRRQDGSVFMWAFDLIELNGDDLRREPLNVRKAPLAAKEPAKPPIIGQRAGDLRT